MSCQLEEVMSDEWMVVGECQSVVGGGGPDGADCSSGNAKLERQQRLVWRRTAWLKK